MRAGRKVFALKSTVCIVGTHPITRDEAPYGDDSVDVWVFNNQPVQGWLPRFDAVFDMHHPGDILRRRKEHPPFDVFLKSTGKPFYTPFPVDECPANVVYPLDEIVTDLFPNFKRGDKVIKYFTSGPVYALALAIHLGYKRIMFYGIEMESNSEYIYQRDGIGLLFGIALGRGIEVVLPPKSMLFYGQPYGYDEDGTKVDREAFETRASELRQMMEQTFAAHNSAKGELANIEMRIAEMQQKGVENAEIQERMSNEYLRARQAYEQTIADHAFVNGQHMDCLAWQSRIEKAMEYGGKAQELTALSADKLDRLAHKLENNTLGKVAQNG